MTMIHTTPRRGADLAAPLAAAVSSILAGPRAALRAYRAWRVAAKTADSLHRLTNRELNDLGLLRGDIEWVSDNMAARHG